MKFLRFKPAYAAVLTLALAGCLGDSPDTLVANAKTAIASRDTRTAFVQLKSALQKDGTHAEARYLLGRLLADSGDAKGALIELQKAYDLAYDPEQVVPALAHAVYLNGDAAKVIATYSERKLVTKPAIAALKTTVALAHVAQDKPDAAMELVNAALAANPRQVDALMLKARLLGAQKKLDEAFALLVIAADAGPQVAEVRKLQGDLWMAKGPDLAAAQAAYAESVKVDPKYVPGYVAQIWLALGKKDIPAAEALVAGLNKVASRHPTSRYLTALLALDKGDLKKANESVQQLLKLAPDNPPALILGGSVDLRLGKLVSAEAAFGKATALSGDNPRPRLMLARTQLRMGEGAKAAKTLQPLTSVEPPNAEAISLLAEAELLQGNAGKAETLFAKAKAIDPNDSRVKAGLAVALMDKGQVEKGMEELRAAAANDPQPLADLTLIAAHLRRKDLAAASKALEGLERKQPKLALAAMLRGQIELQSGNLAKARAAFEKAVTLEPGNAQAQLHLTNLDVAEGKADAAVDRIKKVIAADPADGRARLALISIRRLAGASQAELLELLEQSIKAVPTNAELRLAQIQELVAKRDYKLAFEAAQQGVAALPDSLEMLTALGRTQALTGDLNQAIASFGRLALSAPKSPLPHLEMAQLQLNKGDRAAAIQSYKKAVAIDPRNVQAQSQLIAMADDDGRFGEALVIARNVQAQYPGEAIGHVFEGDLLMHQKNWTGAVKVLQMALAKTPGSAVSIKLHTALLGAGQGAEADRHAREWLSRNPKDVPFIQHLGDTLVRRNELGQAQQMYEKALGVRTDLPVVLNNLAWVLARQGKPEALDTIRRALKLAPNQPTLLDTQAEILAGRGDLTGAIASELAAVDAEPTAHPFRMKLAQYYVAAKQPVEARKHLDVLAKLGPAFPQQDKVKELRAKL
ncbi:XrtA/PEP-CTERM system TPR-repeat protein PrsT [Pelomonas sp. SE-A7]|uniref:XrtA/PEP-CTERM system TPR-repeat protein PrsT n=1 Tax=Pelomonas sp. SE-A7 TaxID=3054953 RepID=UPI00259C8CA4|nr:XrtA/PEP-CTERM system TPR-repeat protein PrsT [Pelomonas sp. SE-A7]MDM4764864.1 PEP-CTERM system TPR-repeat protein PrsT [Pelomonas sp. SE-A7]